MGSSLCDSMVGENTQVKTEPHQNENMPIWDAYNDEVLDQQRV